MLGSSYPKTKVSGKVKAAQTARSSTLAMRKITIEVLEYQKAAEFAFQVAWGLWDVMASEAGILTFIKVTMLPSDHRTPVGHLLYFHISVDLSFAGYAEKKFIVEVPVPGQQYSTSPWHLSLVEKDEVVPGTGTYVQPPFTIQAVQKVIKHLAGKYLAILLQQRKVENTALSVMISALEK